MSGSRTVGLSLLCALSAAPVDAQGSRRRSAVVEVVEKVSPAVVYIGTEQRVQSQFRDSSEETFFRDFFGGRRERKPAQSVQSLGSGVIIDASGIIVTNDHVIRGASAIHVVLADGRQIDAEVVGSDADNDVAVLRISAKTPFPTARLGNSGDLMIGETVVAIGSPFGLAKTVTVGVVSAVGRSFKVQDRVYNDFVQTDAAINPGNSGGPLLNVDGDIVGINTAIFASGQGIGFAIPADKIRRIVSELTQYGKVRPAWVGLATRNVGHGVGQPGGWDRNYGALVTQVDSGSPAERAEVMHGDVVTDLGGVRVEDSEDLDLRLRGYPAKSRFALTLFRQGKTLNVNVTAVEFPPQQAENLAWERIGIRVRSSARALAVTAVRPGSGAAGVGLAPGDFILRLNNQPLGSLEVFREAVLAARRGKSVLLLVQRGRQAGYLTLPF